MRQAVSIQARNALTVSQRLILLMVVSIVLGGIIAAVWDGERIENYLSQVRWFHIHVVRIESSWPLSSDKIRQWLPPLEGKSLLLVKADRLVSLVEQKPWVKSVVVKKRFPDTLVLSVEPRKPKAITNVGMRPFLLDAEGKVIEKVTPEVMAELDLPIISRNSGLDTQQWRTPEIIEIVDRFQLKMPGHRISQVVLQPYPYFSVFLSKPRIEVELNALNWESAISNLSLLISNPPRGIGQIGKISLLLPKKAVVSSSLSN